MNTAFRRIVSRAAAAALLVVPLAGCAIVSNGVGGAATHSDEQPRIAWLSRTELVVKMWSQGCSPYISDLVAGEQEIDVTLSQVKDEGCSDARSARGVYLPLPAGIDSSEEVEVTLTDAEGDTAEIRVPGLATGEHAPADRTFEGIPGSTWIADDELAVLSWGSSSCAPGSGAVTVVGPGEGVVTLHEHTDTICTMDMAPRVTFVEASGLSTDARVSLDGYVDENGESFDITPIG